MELPEIDGPRESEMTKMPRTGVVRLAARTTDLTVLQDAHTGIKETPDLGLIALEGRLRYHFHDRSLLDLLGRHNTELDADYCLHIRGSLIKSRWHLINE